MDESDDWLIQSDDWLTDSDDWLRNTVVHREIIIELEPVKGSWIENIEEENLNIGKVHHTCVSEIPKKEIEMHTAAKLVSYGSNTSCQ